MIGQIISYVDSLSCCLMEAINNGHYTMMTCIENDGKKIISLYDCIYVFRLASRFPTKCFSYFPAFFSSNMIDIQYEAAIMQQLDGFVIFDLEDIPVLTAVNFVKRLTCNNLLVQNAPTSSIKDLKAFANLLEIKFCLNLENFAAAGKYNGLRSLSDIDQLFTEWDQHFCYNPMVVIIHDIRNKVLRDLVSRCEMRGIIMFTRHSHVLQYLETHG